jgi:hypothetical protein
VIDKNLRNRTGSFSGSSSSARRRRECERKYGLHRHIGATSCKRSQHNSNWWGKNEPSAINAERKNLRGEMSSHNFRENRLFIELNVIQSFQRQREVAQQAMNSQ